MKPLITVTSLLLLSSTSLAQGADEWKDWPLGDPFAISIDAFFPNLDTTVRLDASDGNRGTSISFEQNLGMPETETLPAFGFSWRFAKRHRLVVDYFDLSRSGSAVTSSEIRFGDQVFQVELPIASFIDTRVTSIGYGYSLIFDEKKELGLVAGLSVQDISFGLIGRDGSGTTQEAGLTAPLPAFGLSGGYAFTERWVGRLGLGYFSFNLALSDEEALSGEIITAEASIRHHTFENVHFGLKYAYFDVRVDFEELDLFSEVQYTYHGPALSINFVF